MKYIYTGNYERVFYGPPTIVVNKGDIIEASHNPNPAHFKPYNPPTPKPKAETKENQ